MCVCKCVQVYVSARGKGGGTRSRARTHGQACMCTYVICSISTAGIFLDIINESRTCIKTFHDVSTFWAVPLRW